VAAPWRSRRAWRPAPRSSASSQAARISSSATTAIRASPAWPRPARATAAGTSSGWRSRTTAGSPRREGTLVVVDNTFATPLGQQPLRLGADVVVHSATKFIGGHADLLLGIAVSADRGQLERLRAARGLTGATPGTLECFLALRGARTLALRLHHASAGAAELAKRLAEHPSVCRVRYPGFGAIVSFELEDARAADRASAAVRVIRHATSLGGVETTMERRAAHPGQEHIPPGLIRMSVGCEDAGDVWADLDAALRP